MALADSTSSRAPLVLVLFFVLSLPAVTPRINASDEIEFFAWLRSWTFDGDVDFQNEYQHFYDAGPGRNAGFHETFLERTTETGRRLNFAPVGSAILWAPFFLAGHLAALATGSPTDGYSRPYIAGVAYGSAVYGFLAVLLTFDIVNRLLGRSLPATMAAWLGTPLVFYMYIAPGFSHACSAFAVSLFLWIWLRVRERWTMAGGAALGLAGGMMAMVREQDLFFVAGPAVDFLRHAVAGVTRGGRSAAGSAAASSTPGHFPAWPTALVGAACFLLAYLPQLLSYRALNGHFGPTDAVSRKMTWTSPHFVDVLVSPAHGLFVWTPLAIVGVAGLIWLAASRRRGASERQAGELRWIGALGVLMFALQVYVTGSVESWTVAGSFGQRRFVATTPLLAVGVAAIFAVMKGRAGLSLRAAVVVLAIWWNIGLMAQFGLHVMDRQALRPADNARITFLELPRVAPGLVWRYLTDRASFYGLPRQ